jgi:hypothetical protein
MVAIAAVEVLSGARQQVQLARWLLPEVYEALGQRAALSAAGAPASAPRAAGSPRVGPVGARAGGTLGVPTPGVGARIGASRPRARSGPAAGGGPAASATGRPEMVGGTIAAQGLRAVVRALRMMRVDEDTVESAVVVSHVGRVRAVALRLVRRNGRWRAAELVIG